MQEAAGPLSREFLVGPREANLKAGAAEYPICAAGRRGRSPQVVSAQMMLIMKTDGVEVQTWEYADSRVGERAFHMDVIPKADVLKE